MKDIIIRRSGYYEWFIDAKTGEIIIEGDDLLLEDILLALGCKCYFEEVDE